MIPTETNPIISSAAKISYDRDKEINCPVWVNKEVFKKKFDRLTNPDVNSNSGMRAHTLKILNQNQKQQDKALLYLGAGCDLEHPLIATGANKITFVDTFTDSKGSLKTIREKLTELVDKELYNLELDESKDFSEAHFSVLDKFTDQEVFHLDVYRSAYESFIQKADNVTFDIVMDKDSWLGEWDSNKKEEKFLKIGSILKKNGVWIGGYDSEGEERAFPKVKMAMNSLFEKVTDVFTTATQQKKLEWSGYENLEVRIRTQKDVFEIRQNLEAKQDLQAETDNDPIPEALKNLSKFYLDEIRANLVAVSTKCKEYDLARESLLIQLKDGLTTSLPYVSAFDGIKLHNITDEQNELIDNVALCFANFVQKEWNAKSKAFDFNLDQFKQDVKEIILKGLDY